MDTRDRIESNLAELRRQGRINMALFFGGALGVGLPVMLFLLSIASRYSHGRYTFTGSPTLDAIGMGVVVGFMAGGACVGVRQMWRGG